MKFLGRAFFVMILFITVVHSAFSFDPDQEIHSPFEVRVFLKFMLEGVGKTDAEKVALFKEAQVYLKKYSRLPKEKISVSTLEEAIELRHRNLPIWGDREYEIEHLRSASIQPPVDIEFDNDEARKDLELYQKKQVETLRTLLSPLLASLKGPDTMRNLVLNQVLKAIEMKGVNADFGKLFKLIANQNIPEETQLKLSQKFEEIIQENINRFDQVALSVAETQKVKVDSVEGIQRFMEIVLEGYFKNLPTKYKLRMVNDLLDTPTLTDPLEVFRVLVMNATPDFQKVIQVVARKRGIPKELSEIFKVLESKGKPVPEPRAREIINSDPDFKKGKFEFKEGSLRPIPGGGVGTVAQVWLGELTAESVTRLGFPNENIVVRFNKPGVAEGIRDGKGTMEQVARLTDNDPILLKNNFPKLGEILDAVYANMYGDLDLAGAVEKQNAGRENYIKDLTIKRNGIEVVIKFRVPYIGDASEDAKILLIERVSGDKFQKFYDLTPEAGKATALGIRRLWMEEALFKSGNNHQDLHQGNMMVRKLSSNEAGTRFEVECNILDWGMSGFLSPKEQYAFVVLAASALLEGPRTVVKSLWKIKEESGKLGIKDLIQMARAKMSKRISNQSKMVSPPEWLIWGINEKVKFPDSFAGVGRGGETVIAVMESAELSRKEIFRADLKIALRNLIKVISGLVRYSPSFIRDVPAIVVNKGKRLLGKLRKPKPPQAKLPAIEVNSRCIRAFNRI